MTLARRGLIALGLFVAACGGRTDLPDDLGSTDPLGERSCEASGVRLCGGACPALGPPECPGYGCTPALDRDTLAPTSYGVCWYDLRGHTTRPCAACEDGEMCAYRGKDDLVCVPAAVCAALWALGDRTTCRYADKTPYTGEPIPEPEGCPGTLACGGSCPCGVSCIGRSPTHPFGICAPGYSDFVPTCDLLPDHTYAHSCHDDYACAVFDVPAADRVTAMHYGVCLPTDECLVTKTSLAISGGLHCFDASGHEL